MSISLPLIVAVKGRAVMWGLSTALEVVWYLLAAASVLVFLYGVARPIAKYRRGRAGAPVAWRELPTRLRRAAGEIASHAPVRRRAGLAGVAHAGVFYGFAVLFVGTVVLSIDHDVTSPLLGWHFFRGNFYLAYSVVLDVFGVGLTAGLALFIYRRAVRRPARLDYTRPDRPPDDPSQDRRGYRAGDWVFLGALLYLALTGYLLEGVRIAMDHPGYNGFQPVGWLVAGGLEATGLTHAGLGMLRHAIWWTHGVVALAFVAAIPYTKAAHMLTSTASLVLRDPLAIKRLPPVAEGATPGYATLADFTWLHLLDLDACTKCGKCHEACPATASGLPLSPRDVILELREQANDALAHVGIGGVLGHLLRTGAGAGALDVGVVGDGGVREDTVWSCMQCNACVEACPVGIEQAPIIAQMRRHLVEEGEVDAGVQATLRAIHKSGNSFGQNKRKRGRWTDDLDFEVKDARKEPVDVLWFVGDYASFDPRSQAVSRSFARLLHHCGVDFGILYDGERNAGNDVRRVGEEGLFEALAGDNIAVLQECEFMRIVTTDPHSLNTLRNEYPDYGPRWDVLHHTALLVELLEEGRLSVRDPVAKRVTYHDPCHLGRMNGGYDSPRRLIEAIGCELAEMPRNRDNSFCCGAGGGRIWMTAPAPAERPSENRIREALAVGGVEYFVVSCPKDVTMYEDAIKTTGSSDLIELRELTELVEQACVPAAEPALDR